MTEGRKYNHHNFCGLDIVNQPMFLCYAPTPKICVATFERFGVTGTLGRMLVEFGNKLKRFLLGFRFVAKKSVQVGRSLLLDLYVVSHKLCTYLSISSTFLKLMALPRLAFATRVMNSSRLISVSSCFACLTMSLIASMVLRISFSSPAMRDNWRKSS